MPPNCAQVVRWPIAASWRGGHPRSSFPPFGPAGIDAVGGPFWTATQAAFMQAAAAAIQHAINAIIPAVGATLTQVVISWISHKAPRTEPVVFTAGLPEADLRVGTVRKRIPAGGGFVGAE